MIALLIAALLTTQSTCAPPEGFDALVEGPERFIIVGELHGTAEAPAAFAEMVCAAADRGPVTVALELPVDMQRRLEAFLAAPDAASALATLEGSRWATPRMNDGRNSQAMLAMMQSIRDLRAAGRDVAFHAFQPSAPRPPGLTQAWYELDMAHALAGAINERPSAKVLAIVGSIHARKARLDHLPALGLPAAGHLPGAEVVSLRVAQQGGEAWNCQQECTANPVPTHDDPQARGLIMEPTDDGAFDGILALGPSTASPPMWPAP